MIIFLLSVTSVLTPDLREMEVLKDTDVVVGESKGGVCLGKEGVASAWVLEVVDEGPEDKGDRLHILQVLSQATHLGDKRDARIPLLQYMPNVSLS